MSSTITLGFSNSSLGIAAFPAYDVDITTTTIDMQNDIWFGPNFNLGLDFGISMSDIDATGGSAEADLLSFAIEPSYHFGNGAYVGLYYRAGDLDLSLPIIPGLTVGVDTHQMGIFGGYESGPLWVEVFYGSSETDPGLPTGIDVTDYGLAASYEISPQLDVFGSFVNTDIEIGPIGIDLSLLAIGAEYDFGNGLMVNGSVGRLDIGTPLAVDLDATQFSIGVAYDLAQSGAGVPGVISLEYSRTSSDLGGLTDLDIDTFSLGYTIPLGPNASSTPINSNTSIARGQYRSAISGTLAALR